MALVQRTCLRISSFVARHYSNKPTINEKDIKKSVYISQSKDIYTNLAMEDWLYRKFNFTNHHVLLLWQNDPCVVIGRHQNPWLEANLGELPNITENGVQLARRNSNGGAVYHDPGNLNLSFFTPREHHNKMYNLELITRSLFREFGLKVDISSKEDLCIRSYKISNTAAKLGQSNSYHHCTLLVNSNKVDGRLALQKQEVATQSTNSKMMNLCEENPKVTVPSLMKAIGWEFMRTPALTIRDGGMELANQQKGFQMINPTDGWFPGLNDIREKFTGWDWRYGKTPTFNISRSFTVPESLLSMDAPFQADVKVTMAVENGKISDVTLYIPPGFATSGFTGEANVITSLKGQRFSEEAINDLELSINGLINDKEKFVTDCLKQIMTSV